MVKRKSKQEKTNSKEVTVILKRVGRSTDNSGRIYLPGSWIGKTVRIVLKEENK